MARKRKTPSKKSEAPDSRSHHEVVDPGMEPYRSQFQHTLPMRDAARASFLGESVASSRAYEKAVERQGKHSDEITSPPVAPADQLLTDVTLQLLPGKNNPAIIVSRPGVRHVEQKLPQAEYDILLHLARAMRASGRRRSISIRDWGWVERDTLVAIIAGKSHSPGNALYYFGTLVLRIRRRLVALIREVGGEVEPRKIIDNGAPSSIKKKSAYRLSIHPDNLILPA